jgi:hypothetical protein
MVLAPHDHLHINQIRSTPGAHSDPIWTPGLVIAEDPPAAQAGVRIKPGRAFVTEREAAAGPWQAEFADQTGYPLGGMSALLDLPSGRSRYG